MHEKKLTRKSSIGHSVEDNVLYFAHSREHNDDIGCLIETGFNKKKEVAIRLVRYTSIKHR